MISALLAAAVLSQTEPPPPPAASEPLIPPAFLDQALTWDAEGNRGLRGRQKTVLTRTEFFLELGRPDLVQRAEARQARRIALAGTAAGLAIVGVVVGVVLFAGSPDMNSAKCVANIDNFHLCEADNKLHQLGGTVVLATSLATAMLLATLAWWSSPEVDGDEAQHLAAQYNAGLLKRLRGEPSSLRWLPVVGPDGAQLAVAGKF